MMLSSLVSPTRSDDHVCESRFQMSPSRPSSIVTRLVVGVMGTPSASIGIGGGALQSAGVNNARCGLLCFLIELSALRIPSSSVRPSNPSSAAGPAAPLCADQEDDPEDDLPYVSSAPFATKSTLAGILRSWSSAGCDGLARLLIRQGDEPNVVCRERPLFATMYFPQWMNMGIAMSRRCCVHFLVDHQIAAGPSPPGVEVVPYQNSFSEAGPQVSPWPRSPCLPPACTKSMLRKARAHGGTTSRRESSVLALSSRVPKETITT